ncbi:MAG: LamG domain-containing protein, partial [Fidelibacterota bacterium]
NDLGASYREGDVGFLNPNGLVLGSVKTMNQVPVADVEVRLAPNLGLALEFDGQSDFVVFDSLTTLPLDTTYTIEGWFRAYPDFNEQVLFAATAVGHNAHDVYIRIELNTDGKLAYTHRSVAGAAMPDSIVTPVAVNDLTWHHFAAVHDSSTMTLYLDGDPVNTIESSLPGSGNMNLVFGKSSPLDDQDYYHGRLDDFRYWTVARSQSDIRLNDQHTLNGEEPGIYAYWKFDEVLGTKIFDLTNDNVDGYICGLDHTELHAPVYVSGITNEQGEYSIKGIYYGAGTTFNVTPSKETPIGNSLNLDGVDDYVNFQYQRMDLTAGYTLEGWFKTASATDQTLLAAIDPSDGSDHVVVSVLSDGTIQYIQNNTILISTNTFNDEFWHHFAVTYDGTTMILYGDGDVEASQSGVDPVTAESEFEFGRRSVSSAENYVTGKIDEYRLWDSARNEAQIDGTMNQVLNGDENGLIGYWKFNEGFGSVITDNTVSGLNGNLMNAADQTWVEDIPLDEFFSHYFDIESRQATLNPSNTSVDRVDFTDLSTVSATGFVQFQGSACFEEGVELLVDGESSYPPVMTDASGRFLAEFEPGREGAILTPALEGHAFTPS